MAVTESNYYLATADGTKVYRIDYTADDAKQPTLYGVRAVYVTGPNASLPTGRTGAALDLQVDVQNVLIDLVLGNVVPATLADYRAASTAVVAGMWS